MENCFYLQWWDKIDDFINGAQTRFSTAWCEELWFIMCDPEWDEWINAPGSHVKGEIQHQIALEIAGEGESLARWNKRGSYGNTSQLFFSPRHNFNMLWSKEHFSQADKWALKQPSGSLVNNLFLESSGKVNVPLLIVLCHDGKKIKGMLVSAV